MSRFDVTILGANSAIPTANRFPTAQLLNINESYYLIDCGEGTQIQLRKNKLKFQRIEVIFISHLHGDHYFGLIGLLTTMHLLKREKPLKIVGPEKLWEIITLQLDVAGTKLAYPVTFEPISFSNGALLHSDTKIEVTALKLNHRIACAGFVFKQKPKEPSVRKDKIQDHQLTIDEIKELKSGNSIERKGKELLNELIVQPQQPKAYAYVTDTKMNEQIIPFIKEVDLLYHETTFKKHETKRAKETYHSTTHQAAEIALKANVTKLMIGHYSTRYDNLEELRQECMEIFENTVLATEGETILV